ncbi:hypothetical protein ACFYPN_28875 [Streptomyces sp. NPDC005576]|uniref:hypothetical protein n=1 Tax=unclassified Streptomyces TaxID=2593676 RepID=UPI0033C9EC56
MGDVLPALSVPDLIPDLVSTLVLAAGAYAVGAGWWHRRHPVPPSPYTRQALRLAEERTLVTAREILDDAYAAFGPLYTHPASPAPAPAGPAPQAPATRV